MTTPRFRPSAMLHGADYNPEQWRNVPGIWDSDMRLLRQAKLNCVSLGIFAWAELEPEEGVYRFEWMDEIIDRLHTNGQRVLLATPSGAKPNWMAERYPEIRRVGEDGRRREQGLRHNHCLTSPVYRAKVREMNALLARRYGAHPALLAWHVSNEYGGYCYCALCKSAFREWLRQKYVTLEALNDAWWSRFWSHTYTDWQQIDRLDGIHGARIDWKRFMSHQCASFIRNESAPLRELTPGIPTTINMMPGVHWYDYPELGREVDFISWDSYPLWHGQQGDASPHWHIGMWTTFSHDQFRSMKPDEPMLLIETTPSQVNWAGVSPLKRPGTHRTSNLLALSRGSQGVCYFQFRSSRGSSEKYHGTVVSHDGRDDTRVFRDVRATGELMESLTGMLSSRVRSPVAVIFDTQNLWAVNEMELPVKQALHYTSTCVNHYEPFWQRGVSVDVVDQLADVSRYRIVIAPMLQMLLPGTAERLTAFVEQGGILLTTYLSGYVNETDLCFLGGFPGPLRDLLGVRIEELDALPSYRQVPVTVADPSRCGGVASGQARDICELLHAESADVLATYAGEFYAGMPVLTRKRTGKGWAYHLAARTDAALLDGLTASLLRDAGVPLPCGDRLPAGVTVQSRRAADGSQWHMLMNFNETPVRVAGVPDHWKGWDGPTATPIELPPCGARIFTSTVTA